MGCFSLQTCYSVTHWATWLTKTCTIVVENAATGIHKASMTIAAKRMKLITKQPRREKILHGFLCLNLAGEDRRILNVATVRKLDATNIQRRRLEEVQSCKRGIDVQLASWSNQPERPQVIVKQLGGKTHIQEADIEQMICQSKKRRKRNNSG